MNLAPFKPSARMAGIVALVGCAIVVGFRSTFRNRGDFDDGRHVVRFVHWQLDPGIRTTMDLLANEYMRRRPDVRIEQIAIPTRIYASWVRTQLVGGTAPDLIQLGIPNSEELWATYFEPLTAAVAMPNPYNEGTVLAGIPWRDTFIDGLNSFSYRPTLMQNMSIPLATFTTQVHFNRDLWRQILGETPPPEDLPGFLAVCRQVRAYNQTAAHPVMPLAGSEKSVSLLLDYLFNQQTQKLSQTLDRFAGTKAPIEEVALANIAGRWDFNTPAVQSGLQLMQEMAAELQPGYHQLKSEDAAFYFLQGRALMIVAGLWDYAGLRSQAKFPIGIFTRPLPSVHDARYGRNVLGFPSEAESSAIFPFGLNKQSKNPEHALDFLRFVTSHEGGTLFAQNSSWIPAVLGVKYLEEVAPFVPVSQGYPSGFDLSLFPFGVEAVRVYQQSLHLLDRLGEENLARYTEIMQREYPRAVRADLTRLQQTIAQNVARQDTVLAAYRRLASLSPEDPAIAGKLELVSEGQTALEANAYWIAHELALAPTRP